MDNDALQYMEQTYAKEKSHFLRFLRSPTDSIDQHSELAAYVRGKYSLKVAELEFQYAEIRAQREEYLEDRVEGLIIQKDDNGKYYTRTEAERMVKPDTTYRELKRKERVAHFNYQKAKGYLASLDRKIDAMPGKQGLYNKYYETERDSRLKGEE